MPFEKVEGSPPAVFVVLVKAISTDTFAMLGGATNVFDDKGDAVLAASEYVAGPPSNGYMAVVLEVDPDAVFQNVS